MTKRYKENNIFLKKLFYQLDNQLAAILDKTLILNRCTNLKKIFATAVSWAKCPEQDRIKFFLADLMPFFIKDKIREYLKKRTKV